MVIHVDDEVKTYLAEKGYDDKMGARPMARLIQEDIKKPLAEEILFGNLANGGEVHVNLREGQITFDFDEVPA